MRPTDRPASGPALSALLGLVLAIVVAGIGYGLGSGQWAGPGPSTPDAIDSKAHLASAFNSLEGFSYEPPEPGTYQLPAIKRSPDGELLDHNGQNRLLSAVLGNKTTLVSFVYLNCADTEGCPLAMATLWEIFDGSAKVDGLRDVLQLATISFDPKRDTPKALKLVAERLQADRHRAKKLDWHFLTGADQAAVDPLLRGFGQTLNRSGDGRTINHLLRLFLVDRHGQIRNIYGLGSIDPRLIVADVQTLLIDDAN